MEIVIGFVWLVGLMYTYGVNYSMLDVYHQTGNWSFLGRAATMLALLVITALFWPLSLGLQHGAAHIARLRNRGA